MRRKRLRAQRKFAQGAYIPPQNNSGTSATAASATNHASHRAVKAPGPVTVNQCSARDLLTRMSLERAHFHEMQPVVIIEHYPESKLPKNGLLSKKVKEGGNVKTIQSKRQYLLRNRQSNAPNQRNKRSASASDSGSDTPLSYFAGSNTITAPVAVIDNECLQSTCSSKCSWFIEDKTDCKFLLRKKKKKTPTSASPVQPNPTMVIAESELQSSTSGIFNQLLNDTSRMTLRQRQTLKSCQDQRFLYGSSSDMSSISVRDQYLDDLIDDPDFEVKATNALRVSTAFCIPIRKSYSRKRKALENQCSRNKVPRNAKYTTLSNVRNNGPQTISERAYMAMNCTTPNTTNELTADWVRAHYQNKRNPERFTFNYEETENTDSLENVIPLAQRNNIVSEVNNLTALQDCSMQEYDLLVPMLKTEIDSSINEIENSYASSNSSVTSEGTCNTSTQASDNHFKMPQLPARFTKRSKNCLTRSFHNLQDLIDGLAITGRDGCKICRRCELITKYKKVASQLPQSEENEPDVLEKPPRDEYEFDADEEGFKFLRRGRELVRTVLTTKRFPIWLSNLEMTLKKTMFQDEHKLGTLKRTLLLDTDDGMSPDAMVNKIIARIEYLARCIVEDKKEMAQEKSRQKLRSLKLAQSNNESNKRKKVRRNTPRLQVQRTTPRLQVQRSRPRRNQRQLSSNKSVVPSKKPVPTPTSPPTTTAASTLEFSPIPMSTPVPAQTFGPTPTTASMPLSAPIATQAIASMSTMAPMPISAPVPTQIFVSTPTTVPMPISLPMPTQASASTSTAPMPTVGHTPASAPMPISAPVPTQTFASPPYTAPMPISTPVLTQASTTPKESIVTGNSVNNALESSSSALTPNPIVSLMHLENDPNLDARHRADAARYTAATLLNDGRTRRKSYQRDISQQAVKNSTASVSQPSPLENESMQAGSTSGTQPVPTPLNGGKAPNSQASEYLNQTGNAPVFRPTLEEFEDPITYIKTIEQTASKYGICKIIPPAEFNIPCHLDDNSMFTTINQYLNRLYQRWGPNLRELTAIQTYVASLSNPRDRDQFIKTPIFEGVELDLVRLYHQVLDQGGIEMVLTHDDLWIRIIELLSLVSPRGKPDPKKLEKIYCKHVLPYESLTTADRDMVREKIELVWNERLQSALRRAKHPLYYQRSLLGDTISDDDDEPPLDSYTYEVRTIGKSCFDRAEECTAKGRSMNLSTFRRIAAQIQAMRFGDERNLTTKEVEEAYWNILNLRQEHVCVLSAFIDTSVDNLGHTCDPAEPGSRHPWNLKRLSENPQNILRSLGKTLSVTVPTLCLNQLFSTNCWHKDPHHLAWMDFMHEGATKIWYAVPELGSNEFRTSVEFLIPSTVQNKGIWLTSDTTMIPPSKLLSLSVPVYRIEQNPGEFIVVFPGAYASSIATGLTISESIYFENQSWLSKVDKIFRELRQDCEPAMFSITQLLMRMARDPSVSKGVLKNVYNYMTELIQDEFECRTEANRLNCKIQIDKSGRPGGGQAPTSWPNQEECSICRIPLILSKMSRYNDPRLLMCLKHGLRVYNRAAEQERGLPPTVTLLYSNEELTADMDALKLRLSQRTTINPSSSD